MVNGNPNLELLQHTTAGVDGEDAFFVDHTYVVRERVFGKVNPFEATPERVGTKLGELPTAQLEKVIGTADNDNEFTSWVEYRLAGEVVHRSADVKIKRMPSASSSAAGGF